MLLDLDAKTADGTVSAEEQRKLRVFQLFNHLFQICNILRGPINQDEFKSYVIPILFFQRISDCYDEETAAAKAKYVDDVSLYSEEELHPFKMPPGCHWSDIRCKTEDIGKAIVDAMMELENINQDSLNRLFSSFDDANWTDKKNSTIKVVARYQQYEGATMIIECTVENKIKKGLVWHFQGSGKSPLMVFARKRCA